MKHPVLQNTAFPSLTLLFTVLLLLFSLQQSGLAQTGSFHSKLKLKKNNTLQETERPMPSGSLIPKSSTTVCLWDGRGEFGKEHFQCLPEVRVQTGNASAEVLLEKWWVSWSTEQTGFAKAIYQVSMFPFPSGYDNWQSPPGLLKTGTVEQWSGKGQQPFFTIDISSSLSGGKTRVAEKLSPVQQKPDFARKQPLTLQQSTKQARLKRSGDMPRAYSIYVRIITLDRNNNLTATPSQAAVMHLSTQGTSQFIWYGDPNPNPERPAVHAPVIHIVSYDHFQPNLSDWDRQFIVTRDMPMLGYSKDDEIFIPHDDGSKSGWEAITGAIGNLAGFATDCINRVADAYNGLKQKALNLAISLAKKTVGCGQTCQDAFNLGLNYGMTVMGMPPTLPNFDAMMSLGKEYLIAQVAAEVSPYLSEDDVSKAIDYLESEVRKTADTGTDGSQWLRLNPKYQYHDAMLLLEVSNPTAKVTDAISCLIHQQKEAFYFPFQPKDYYINVPPIKPGQTIRIPVLLRPNNVQCNNGKGMLMPQWNTMMKKGVLLQVYPGRNVQILVKQ
jgi:hypothetical protein